MTDILRLHQNAPTYAHGRLIDLSRLVDARSRSSHRISWPALFIRALGAVCARNPRLQQTWRSWPWQHLYQHRSPVAVLTVSRAFEEDEWLFWGRIFQPEKSSLTDLQAVIDRFTDDPVESIFRRQLRFSRLPVPVRRLIWWWNLNVTGERRARRLGTYFLTTVSGRGTEIQHPPGFMTSGLTYGPLDEAGRSQVTVAYDHRLMDGMFIADRLAELDDELNDAVLNELSGFSKAVSVSDCHAA